MRFAKFAFVLMVVMGAAHAGDAKRGAAIFMRCAACHNADKDGGSGLGPNLFGVVGRKAASVEEYSYSPALKKSGIIWTNDALKKWVSNPAKMVPGTRMAFAGLTSATDAADVVAYLDTLR